MRVEDAQGLPPNLPFWLGEAPGRSAELSMAVGRLREEVDERLSPLRLKDAKSNGNSEEILPPSTRGQNDKDGQNEKALHWLITEVGLSSAAAEQIVEYLASARAALGVMPTQKTLVLERFFDEAGDMHLVIHSPFGSRLNRASGLSLRKRFCRKFNFELQAAAGEDAIVLSLGSTHSFPIEQVYSYLKSATVKAFLFKLFWIRRCSE